MERGLLPPETMGIPAGQRLALRQKWVHAGHEEPHTTFSFVPSMSFCKMTFTGGEVLG